MQFNPFLWLQGVFMHAIKKPFSTIHVWNAFRWSLCISMSVDGTQFYSESKLFDSAVKVFGFWSYGWWFVFSPPQPLSISYIIHYRVLHNLEMRGLSSNSDANESSLQIPKYRYRFIGEFLDPETGLQALWTLFLFFLLLFFLFLLLYVYLLPCIGE